MKSIIRTTAISAALCLAFAAAPAVVADEPDSAANKPVVHSHEVIHRHPAHPIAADTSSSQDPYKDCKPNPEKAAKMKKHPMPQTKGMQNMDPKLHEMDCPEPVVKKTPELRHVHKPPGG